MEKLVKILKSRSQTGEQFRVSIPKDFLGLIGAIDYLLISVSPNSDSIILKPVEIQSKK